ncbi:PAAR-like domain-containing protein, partial [Citrobacter koseri]|uniref:PAAR-like domain-containing protein n=2 Tax=Citrobacter koseri TaxID=545 RepID=UPI000AE599A8
PATPGFQKGISSGAIKGKAYFKSWSPNVKFEGLEVPRHEDLMTHNHGSTANTPPSYYLDRSNVKEECANQMRKMKVHCKPDNPHVKNKKGVPAKRENNSGLWVTEHCGPLMLKPGLEQFDNWKKDWDEIGDFLEKAKDNLKNNVIDELETKLGDFIEHKIEKQVGKGVLKKFIPYVGWVMTVADVKNSIEQYKELKEEIKELKNITNKLDDALKKIEKYKNKINNFENLSEKEQRSLANEIMAETQSAYALYNRCIRARKCMLVPFSKTDSLNSWEGKGCCPGQTGHHLLPDTMFRDQEAAAKAREKWNKDPKHRDENGKLKYRMPRDKYPTKKCWGQYREGKAPTICLEGKNNHTGSHGVMHSATARLIKAGNFGKEMNYEIARDIVIKEVALMYGCDKSCLKAQMDKAYRDVFTCSKFNAAKVNADAGDGKNNDNDEDI